MSNHIEHRRDAVRWKHGFKFVALGRSPESGGGGRMWSTIQDQVQDDVDVQ